MSNPTASFSHEFSVTTVAIYIHTFFIIFLKFILIFKLSNYRPNTIKPIAKPKLQTMHAILTNYTLTKKNIVTLVTIN